MEETTVIVKRPYCLFWSEAEKWTPLSSHLRFGKIPDGWKLLSVSEFAKQVEVKERVEADAEYRMVGVRGNGGGVFHRETVLGKEQSASYLYPVKPGTIIYNRLFAWKGSFAVVGNEFSGFYVSNEFPQFDIDEKIAIPEYVYLLFTSNKVINAVKAASIGSSAVSRNRLIESELLGFRVPIPPLPIQQIIVAYWEAAQTVVQHNFEGISRLRLEAFEVFRKALGIKTSSRVRPKLFTVHWREVDRWGHELVWKNKGEANSFVYPVKPLKKVCKTGSGGTPSRKHKEYYGGEIPWVKTTEVRNTVITDTDETITSKGLASSSAKLYPAGSLVIAMYGQGATRGRTAKLGVDAATNQACLVLTEIDSALDTDFLWYYLMVSYEEMRGLASGNNQPNLSANLLSEFLVPIPPLKKQAELKALIERMQHKVSKLEDQSALIRSKTTREIEKMILGTLPVEVF